MALDTLANVKARLGISGGGDDTLLGLLQASADRFIANWCERDFEGGTFTEYFSGATTFAPTRNFPIASIVSVKVDPARAFGSDTIISPARYVTHSERGVVQAIDGRFFIPARDGLSGRDLGEWTDAARVVQIVYTVAADAVPADVKAAYARLIGHWYRQVKTDVAGNYLDVMQQKYGDTFVIYDRQASDGAPREILEMLAPYREPRC
jgi:predicted SpoU family rRNA methylase